MSLAYDNYIIDHKNNVLKAFEWLVNHDLVDMNLYEVCRAAVGTHDDSKYQDDEYEAYDAYFYGGNRSYQVKQDFEKAFLMHLHRNPHHWQHWVLINDGGEDHEEVVFRMPYEYGIEMICDWWSFSWKSGDLYGIFDWYEGKKDGIRLHPDTRAFVEGMLDNIKDILDEEK